MRVSPKPRVSWLRRFAWPRFKLEASRISETAHLRAKRWGAILNHDYFHERKQYRLGYYLLFWARLTLISLLVLAQIPMTEKKRWTSDWTKKLNFNVDVIQEQSRITKVRKYNSRFTVFRTSCCCEYCTWPWNFHKLVFIHQFRCACLQSELNRDWCQMVVLLWHSEWPRRVLRWIFKAELEGETFV